MRNWVRRHRWLSGLLAAVLLCAQVAVSAYACPQPVAVEPVALPACHGADGRALDPAQPLLCKAHCEAGPQSVNNGAGTASVPPPALIDAPWRRMFDVAKVAQLGAPPPAALPAGLPLGAPPLYIALLVLRN